MRQGNHFPDGNACVGVSTEQDGWSHGAAEYVGNIEAADRDAIITQLNDAGARVAVSDDRLTARSARHA